MKKNISFGMLLRVIQNCSTFQCYINERNSLRKTLLLNKYSADFLEQQFNRVLLKSDINQPYTLQNDKILQE